MAEKVTLDCASVFTLTIDDAALVHSIVSDFDAEDPYARSAPKALNVHQTTRHFAMPNELEFAGDPLAQKAYAATLQRLTTLGWQLTAIDFAPFRDLARMLYEGPWVAERFTVMEALLQSDAPGLDPTVKSIVQNGGSPSAVQAFRAEYRRADLARRIAQLLAPFDALIVPTIPTAFTLEAVQAEPLRTNSLLGTYTNFTNLADLCGLAVPGVFREDGLPAGITLLAQAWNEAKLLQFGAAIEAQLKLPRGATGVAHAPSKSYLLPAPSPFSVAVVGAHLSGLALNPQLTGLGGTLVRATTTAATYKLFVLPNSKPVKPGMVRAAGGSALNVEVWALPAESFAQFVALVPPPLCIGNVELSDGSIVKGFLCEPYAVEGAKEITSYGGFRSYLASLTHAS